MEISARIINLFLLFTTIISLCIFAARSDPDSERVSELLSLQSGSESGVIRLNDHSVSRFLTSVKTPRPYSIIVFFEAEQLHDKSELHLPEIRREFGILASSFIANNANRSSSSSSGSNANLFFCDIEFRESQSSFGVFGVNSLPNIRFVGPTTANLKDESQPMGQGDFARMAESMAEFVESKTKLKVGPIHRPPILSKKQLALVIVLVLILTPFVIKKILTGQTLVHDPKVWLSGAVFVYFFSVSGAMHNIIRKMPMFLADRNDPSKLIFFYQGSGMQLGAEGFAVGFLYTVVGLMLAFLTNVLVRVKNVTIQRFAMLLALFISFWAVKKVIYLDNWKTGYGIHGFWPSSWY